MSTELKVNEDSVKMAIELVTDVLSENGISKLEGGVAMRAILDTLAQEGLDIRSAPRMHA